MREIKFRTWHRILEEMRGNHTAIQILRDRNSYFVDSHNHLYTLMQYTGLNDKNQKEIYEGDVVRFSDQGYGAVCGDIYFAKSCFFVRHNTGDHNVFFYMTEKELEVIGNIYQNPELTINK